MVASRDELFCMVVSWPKGRADYWIENLQDAGMASAYQERGSRETGHPQTTRIITNSDFQTFDDGLISGGRARRRSAWGDLSLIFPGKYASQDLSITKVFNMRFDSKYSEVEDFESPLEIFLKSLMTNRLQIVHIWIPRIKVI